ncbi:DUF6571 family protein [Streptomyces sp. NPDC049881]|uniref:DUF6571 family protein n=1 Tax=Streptomyces sp. NPDC049881 TaxID=3155778 RepID=UPI0034270039
MARSTLTFEELLHLQLAKLDEAAEEWDLQVRRLDDMKDLADAMGEHARTATWTGENAGLTLPYVTEQVEQFDAARRQAATLRNLLRDGHGRLKYAQDRLKTLVESDAPRAGVHVSASGEVSSDLDGLDGDTRRARQDAVVEIAGRITEILGVLAQDDAEIAAALRSAMGTDPDRFSPVDYTSVQQARLAREDADRVLDMMARGNDLSDDELHDLALFLDLHRDDPAFAERVALGLGPQGVVDFWSGIAGGRDFREGTPAWDSAAALQAALGDVLGTATRSDSDAMERWEQDMTALGDDRVGGPGGPHGFLAMSALLRTGDYDPDFLVDYGDALLSFEQDYDGRPSMLWDSDPRLRMNFLGEGAQEGDRGRDPVIGLMEALGRTPEAATRFFAPPDGFSPSDGYPAPPQVFDPGADNEQVNERLRYLASEREWWLSTGHMAPDPIPVHDSFADALFAAATGNPSGVFTADTVEERLADGDMRTADTTRVMDQVMHLYGTLEPNLLEETPAMGAALGAMAGLYMDDINFWISDDSEAARRLNEDLFGSPDGERAGNGHTNTIRFLGALGRDETAHGMVSQAEQIYTLGVLSASPPTDESQFLRGMESISTAAEVRGIVDQARVETINTRYMDDEGERIRQLGQSSGWWKAGGAALLGAGAAGLSLAAFPGGAAIAVPLAAGASPPLIGELMNQFVDDVSVSSPDTAQVEMTESQFFTAGKRDVADLEQIYVDAAINTGLDLDTEVRLPVQVEGAGYRHGRDLYEEVGR